jgi:dTDP-4-dehydrorhamnose reductase
MIHILVTGANGQLGSEIRALAKNYPDWTFTYIDIEELDLTNRVGVKEYFSTHQFNYCINCAAYTAVDKAESDEKLARKVNATAVQYIAEACHETKAGLIHLSTDYVYHNDQNTPFKEGDVTTPQGIYALTKLEGDNIAREVNPNKTLILRTSWVYSSFGQNFVKTMLRLGRDKEQISVIFDQIGSPTYAHDLAEAILIIIGKVEKGEVSVEKFNDLYHYSNEGVTSWYDFAKTIFNLATINCKVIPIETKDYPTPAKRPPFSLLNKSKFKEAFGLDIPYWRDSLQTCLKLLGEVKFRSFLN